MRGEKTMENTVIEQEGTVTDDLQENRTFTQEEVNNIISNRLKKESAKFSDYEELKAKASKLDEMEEANKSELQKATEKANALQQQIDAMNKANDVRNIREKVALDTGVPASLLHGENEEDCMEQAYGILAFMNEKNANKYPEVKDGGEIQNLQKGSAEAQFAEWFNQSLK